MIYGLPIQGLGAVVSKKSPRPAAGTVGPSPPLDKKVLAEKVPTSEGMAVFWDIYGSPMARLGDVDPRGRPPGDPDSLVPAVYAASRWAGRKGLMVLPAWPGPDIFWGLASDTFTWRRGSRTPGGMHLQAVIHRNRLASLAGPWKGASVTPAGHGQPTAAERDLWTRPYSALPSGLVWRRDDAPRGEPPVRAAMGSSPSKGEQTVWDASPAAPDRPRGTPWEHEEVRPYAPEPPPAPLASATAAHRGPGRVVLRLAKADRPLIESVAVGMKDGRRINLVVVRPSDKGGSVLRPGVRLAVLKNGTSRLDLRMERGVPFILVVDGTGGKVPLTLVGLAHIRAMGKMPWIATPEAVPLRDDDRARQVIVAGLEALAKAREKAAANAPVRRMTPAQEAAHRKQDRVRQRADQERQRAAVAARSKEGSALVAAGRVPASGTDVDLGKWVAGIQRRLRELVQAERMQCPPDRPIPSAHFTDPTLRRAHSDVATWAYRSGGGVRAAATKTPQPPGAWATVRAAVAALAAGQVTFDCVEDVG